MNPDSPMPCVKCRVACVVADEAVGDVHCAACGHEFVVSVENWKLVHAKDIAFVEEEVRREREHAEERKTKGDLEAWERMCLDLGGETG